MDSEFLQVFVLWPGVVVLSALISMLTQWRFSWSELIVVALAGTMLGLFFFRGTEPDATGFEKFGLVFSHGLWGLLFLTDRITSREDLFWTATVATLGATLVAGILDRVSIAIGTDQNWGGFFLSLLVLLPVKLPFALFTTAVGVLLFVVGSVPVLLHVTKITKDFGEDSAVGLNGGLLYAEWDNSSSSKIAITLGATVQVWAGTMAGVIEHEIYHSRQYLFLRDWMIPAYLFGGVWGLVSSAIDGSFSMAAFVTAKHDKDVGNPMECVGWQIIGHDPGW